MFSIFLKTRENYDILFLNTLLILRSKMYGVKISVICQSTHKDAAGLNNYLSNIMLSFPVTGSGTFPATIL